MKRTRDYLEASICGDCLQVIANDDWGWLDYTYNDEDEADTRRAEIERGLESVPGYWIAGTDELGFSWMPCECCRSPLGGERHQAFVDLID